METILTILGVALVLFALIGVITIAAVLMTLVLIKDGAMLTFGYEQDDADEQ